MRKFWLPFLMALLALGAFARGQKDAPVILESDGPQYVSPNHDGIKDTAVLGFTVKIKLRSLAGYIPKYGIQVIDKDGNVVNEIEGKEQRDISGIEAIGRDYEFFEMRREIMWDLRGTDGELVPDGEYVVRVWVEDANRNRSELDIEKFIVDTVAPTVELAFKDGADSLWFSPKGQRKTAEILVNGAEEALWVLQIVDEEDEPVVTKRLSDSALEEFIWDGCDDNGNFVADGNYAFKVMGEDYAGNKSEPALLAGIRVDNRPTAVTASAEFDGFSPNGDGKRDTLDVKLDYKLSTDFVSWSWRIEKTENPESTDAETAAGEGPQPTMKSGDVVEMDEELAAVSEEAAADNNSDETAVDAPVAVSDGAEAEPLTDIEEAEETVEEPTAAESEEIVSLEEETAEEASVAVEEEAIAGTETEAVSVEEFNAPADPEVLPSVITLNGKDENGNVLEDGWYRFVFSVEYKNGNKEEAFLPFLIDTVAPTVELKSVANPFVKVEPNSAKGEYFITLDAKDEGTLEGWDMEILDDKDSVLKMFAGEGDPSRLITWNGEVADVNEETGVYYIDFTVIDKGGNETIIRRPVVLDILLIERDGKYYLMVPNIIFGAYQFELDSYGEEQYQKNLESIDRVIDIYKRYPTYNLVLEGHALNIYDPQTQADENLEEEKILEPLTVNRAGEVQDALIERGFDFEKVIVHTFGGKNPIFSISDENENWKNRRVEFVMELKPIEELIKMVETETAAEAVTDEEIAETEAAAEETVTAAEESESAEAETVAEVVADEETVETEAAAEETVTAAEETESAETETAAEAADEETAETEAAEISVDEAAAIGDEVPAEPTDDGDLF